MIFMKHFKVAGLRCDFFLAIKIETVISEYAPGQFELTLKHLFDNLA